MCPEEQLLSAYVDNELPEKWKESVADHLETCEICSDIVNGFRSLKQDLLEADVNPGGDVLERVYQNIRVRATVEETRPFFTRRVPLPLPAVAAAAVLVIVSLGLFFFDFGKPSEDSAVAVSEIIIPPEEVGFQTLEEAIRLFESHNAHIEIYIQLPDETQFARMGEPLLVREADFHPGTR